MIESWEDVLTEKQYKDFLTASVTALISFEITCSKSNILSRLEIAYMNGMRLCFYPVHIAEEFGITTSCIVVEDNFQRCGVGILYPMSGDYGPYNPYWVVLTFKLTPKYLEQIKSKLIGKVAE